MTLNLRGRWGRIPCLSQLSTDKETVFKICHIILPYCVTKVWALEVDAGEKCKMHCNLSYPTNIFRLIESNTDVLTGGTSSIAGTQKKFIQNFRLEYLNGESCWSV
jgi:hypothetical protein